MRRYTNFGWKKELDYTENRLKRQAGTDAFPQDFFL